MESSAIAMFVGLTFGVVVSENINDNVKELVERMVNDLVNQQITEMKKEFQSVTDDLRQNIDLLKVENMKQNSVIEELRNHLDKLTTADVPENDEKTSNEQDVVINNVTENVLKEGLPGLPLSAALFRGRRASPGNIAFCAYLSRTQTHLTGEAVRFDQVLLNDGGGYNSYTGAFTAPLSGVYLFNFHFDTTNKITFVRLVINGVNQVDAVANQHTNSDHRRAQSMGGNSAVLHVNHGQAVLVEVYEIADVEVASSDTFRLSTFSGVLLY